ncbi:MAG: nitrilase-related carbon-nitrogen hydrolase, partial [Candidatus Thorarchaeota archaeon]
MREVTIGLVQAKWEGGVRTDAEIRDGIEKMLAKHERFVEEAASKGVQIVCFQELFFGPYFAAEQDRRWFEYAEPIPGPITDRFAALAEKHRMVIILPIFEEESPGFYYNTTVILDTDGEIVGIYRKSHIP